MKIANILTGEIRNNLPSGPVILTGQLINNPTLREWALLGWREVVETEQPADGYRVGEYNVVEIDGATCRLTIKVAINIADEAAAAAAALAAALAQQEADEKAEASRVAELGTVPIERAVRAFAALALQEINALRTKAGLSTYTAQQFLTAWRNKL